MPTRSHVERVLRGASLRVTRPRVAVLSAVHEHAHVDADSIIAVVRADLGEVSKQAVYDVLRALKTAGLVRHIEPAGSAGRYEARVGDNHHHAVCRSCGAIADVDCAVGDTPCLTACDDHGFAIEEAEVLYWGQCPQCVTAPSATSGADRTRRTRYRQRNPALDSEQPRPRETSYQKRSSETGEGPTCLTA